MAKRDAKQEKALRNETNALRYKRYDKESRKKRRRTRVKLRDQRAESKFWGVPDESL